MVNHPHRSKLVADLLTVLRWIKDEAGQYADGAPDAHPAQKLLTVIEAKASAAVSRAEGRVTT